MLRLTLAIAFLTTFGFIAVIIADKIIGKNKKEKEKEERKKEEEKTTKNN